MALTVLGATACSTEYPPPTIASGTARGGEFADGFYEWELRRGTWNTRGVELRVPGLGRSVKTAGIAADGPDDVAWVTITHPAVDAAAVAIGGAREDVDEVILVLGDGTEVPMELFDVEGRSWNAVMAELPRQWAASGGLTWDVVALRGGEVIEQVEDR